MYYYLKSMSLLKSGLGHTMTATAKAYNSLSAKLILASSKEAARIQQQHEACVERIADTVEAATHHLIVSEQRAEEAIIRSAAKAEARIETVLNLA